MARDRTGITGGIVVGLVALAICGGLLWYGTGYTYERVREAVAYSRASFCPEAVETDPNCVKVADAVVTDRTRDTTSDTTTFHVDLQAPGHSDHVRVGSKVHEQLQVGDEVKVWRFHGKVIAIEHGDQRWGTHDTPGPPYLAGLVGTLFWAAAFGLAALAATAKKARPTNKASTANRARPTNKAASKTANKAGTAPTRWDFRLYFGALVVAVGLIVGGFVVDYALDVADFDPRLIYASLGLTPAVSVGVVVKYAIKGFIGRARP